MAHASVDDESEPLRPQTRDLIKAIVFDVWPSPGTIIDFGLDSQAHYEAISAAYRHGDIGAITIGAALGNGPLLTDLIRLAPNNPHPDIAFRTSSDSLLVNDGANPDGMQQLPYRHDHDTSTPRSEEAEGERLERYYQLLFSSEPIPKGVDLPPWVTPPDRSKPDALQRVERDIASLRNGEFVSFRWAPTLDGDYLIDAGPSRSWGDLSEVSKHDVIRRWIGWQGVAVHDRAAAIAGSLDLGKLPPATLDRLMHSGGVPIEEPADWWERLSPSQIADNGTARLATSGGKPMSPSAIADSKPPRPEPGHSRNPEHER